MYTEHVSKVIKWYFSWGRHSKIASNWSPPIRVHLLLRVSIHLLTYMFDVIGYIFDLNRISNCPSNHSNESHSFFGKQTAVILLVKFIIRSCALVIFFVRTKIVLEILSKYCKSTNFYSACQCLIRLIFMNMGKKQKKDKTTGAGVYSKKKIPTVLRFDTV